MTREVLRWRMAVENLERRDLLSLGDYMIPTDVTAQSGHWRWPSTWEDRTPPRSGDVALIAAGHDVIFSGAARVKDMRVDGDLVFRRHSLLVVDTIVVSDSGRLQIGPYDNARHGSSRIVFGTDGTGTPDEIGGGLIVEGTLLARGTPRDRIVATDEILAGSDTITFSGPPSGWAIGDRLIVHGTTYDHDDDDHEIRRINAIDGATVTVSQPFAFDHRPPDGYGFEVYVGNMASNVVFQSRSNSIRAHTMMRSNDVHISDVIFDEMGRTDKFEPVSASNRAGRYPLHFHQASHARPETGPALVHSVVIDGSPGWGVVNHGSEVHVTGSVAYGVLGASYVAEDGDERGSFRGNLSVWNEGSLRSRNENRPGKLAHRGHGLWSQAPQVLVEGNILTGAADSALAISGMTNNPDVPATNETFRQIRDNIAIDSFLAISLWKLHNDAKKLLPTADGEYSVIKGTVGYALFSGGRSNYASFLRFEHSLFVQQPGVFAGGFSINTRTGPLHYLNNTIIGFVSGITTGFRHDTIIEGGLIEARSTGVRVRENISDEPITITIIGVDFGNTPTVLINHDPENVKVLIQ